jgi:tetratricopeptide (TPR) repeat protein
MVVARGISPLRRFAIAFLALGVSAFFFRGPMASSLITRGDGAFQAGDLRSALRFYRRSLVFDPTSPVGAERFTTIAMASNDLKLKSEALGIATRELATDPDNARIRLNRALILQRLDQKQLAYDDFLILARISPNPAVVEFAARLALRHKNVPAARAAFARTLQIDPKRTSARVALSRLDASHG